MSRQAAVPYTWYAPPPPSPPHPHFLPTCTPPIPPLQAHYMEALGVMLAVAEPSRVQPAQLLFMLTCLLEV